MNKTVGEIIQYKRKILNLTQKDVADRLCVTEQAISRWERNIGLPDVSILTNLAKVLNINVNELLNGEITSADNVGGNMKKIKFYFCPKCGNVVTAMSNCDLTCCGEKLLPLEAQKSNDEHFANVEMVEDEFYISINHEMQKQHFITFIAYQTMDKLFMVKLYPEQNAEVRFKKYGIGKLYVCCNQHNLFEQIIK